MLLKSINIQGFKSFADKTQLLFGKGITAVVGPNGSGKSNISDAVRWVLGEQSTKSLRGSSMEDVIFIGSDTRRAQGFAEVTLTIDNTDRSLNFDNDTVAVTRRYYRSHESEYLINGISVRLRDVNELFMDTGLGRDGYSMIGQGKIDSIVGAKPQERRDIFEEASGISRYRYRKSEAERKLNAAEENMVRLKDIFGELEARVGPLKSQSEKAEKYLKLRDERKNLEIGLWLNALDNSKDALREQERKITTADIQYKEIGEQLSKLAENQEEFAGRSAFITSAIEQDRRKAAEYEENAARIEGDIAVENNTIEHNNQNIERIKLEIDGLRGSDETAKENVLNEKKRLDEKRESLKQNSDEISCTNADMNALLTKSEGFSKQIEELAMKLNALSRDESGAQVQMVTAQTALSEIAARRGAVNTNKIELESALKGYEEELKKLYVDRETLQDSIKSYDNAAEGYKMRYDVRKSSADKLQKELENKSLELKDTERRTELLKELEKNMEGFQHAVKKVIKEAENGTLRGICGPVIRLIKADAKHSVAIETALAAAAQNIVVETEGDAKRAIKLLKETKAGRATFWPVSTAKSRPFGEKGMEELDGFVGIAADLVECDKKYREVVYSLLGGILMATDLDAAVDIAAKYGRKYKVVSLDGQVVNTGGSLTGGSLSKHTGLLSRAGEIEKLGLKTAKLQNEIKEKQSELNAALQSLEATQKDIAETELERKTANEDLIRVLGELRRIDDMKNSAESGLKSLEKESADLDEREVQLEGQIKAADNGIEGFKAEKSELEAKMEEISGGRTGLEDRRRELSARLTELRLKNVELQKDIEQIERNAKQLEQMISDRTYRAEQLELQIKQLEEHNRALFERIESLKNDISNSKQRAAEMLNNAEKLRLERDENEKQTVESRAEERRLLESRENLGKELARLQERREVMTNEYDNIIKRLFDEYELTRSEAEQLNIQLDDPSIAKKELAEIKSRMKALGNVNVGAIEEYREVSERYEFYKVQIDDVEKTRTELYKLINNLTGTMRDMFTDGFGKINRNFQKTFTDLFGGGSAELILSDPENVLESGIDISVRIPGKTVSKIEPLSGGEKALVAISIYFAIMMVNPPPFCLLDEVESALDEVNVDRVAEYMHHMNDSTQFICITHRRGTMEAADMLYGVTMQEKGVSKLLELNVAELEKKLNINN